MTQLVQQIPTVGFKTVQLFKDQTLGIGSYGKVCKAKCDDLLCAAKLIHETLFDPTAHQLTAPQREHRLPMRRFEQECDFLSTIRHPNIVQYLGIHRDPDTGLPALLMELMDDSLTHFLESSSQPIPYHIQVNICHDITLALSFLHSNSIVHRDLSSNNVLLVGNAIRAKVTDFGMARLGDQNTRATNLTFTMCPGADVYMAPEAVQDNPMYTEKIDCFSFGVITLQILTRQFPKPGDRRKRMEINHPELLRGMYEMVVSEIERRQNHISTIDPNHTLLQVSLDCLKDKDVERPSAQQLCVRVAALKESPEYSESVRAAEERNTAEIEERERVITSLRNLNNQQFQIIQTHKGYVEENYQAVREKDGIIAAEQQQVRELQNDVSRLEREKNELKEEKERLEREKNELKEEKERLEREKNELKEEKERLEREKNQVIEDKGRQLGHVNQQLEDCEQVIDQFHKRIAELEQLRSATDATPRRNRQSSSSNMARIKTTWREGRKAPCKISAVYNAVTDGIEMYVRRDCTVYAYIISTTSWSRLSYSPTYDCPLVIVNNLLTLVGGNRSGIITNQLLSLTDKGGIRRWTEKFPTMPTRREGSTALCTGTALIVAGGISKRYFTLPTVEIMNTDTLQWSTAAHLPQPLEFAPGAVCGDHIYILTPESPSKSMYTCPASALVQSCWSRHTLSTDVWNKVAAPPVTDTSCVPILGRLLTIGGVDSKGKATTAIYMYNPDSYCWRVISRMATAKYNCLAAVLPNNQLIVVFIVNFVINFVNFHVICSVLLLQYLIKA